MKKLIVAISAVALAVAAQAASVSWKTGSSYLVDNTGTKQTALASGEIWLVVLSDTTGWSAGEWTGTAATVTELQQATIVSSGKASAKGKITQDYAFTYGDQAFSDGDTLAVVFKDGDGNYAQIAYYDSTKEDKVGAAITDVLVVSGLSDSEALWTGELSFATGGNFLGQAVPEPTSGLLLLVGGALLALKRKRA